MHVLKKLCWILIAIVAVWLGFWVVFDNPDPIAFTLFGFEIAGFPGGLWLLWVFALGCLMGVLFSLPAIVQARRRARSLNKQLLKLKATDSNTPPQLQHD